MPNSLGTLHLPADLVSSIESLKVIKMFNAEKLAQPISDVRSLHNSRQQSGISLQTTHSES
jgi:hypothetical protein